MTKVVIVANVTDIPLAARKRGSMMEKGRKVWYRSLDQFNGTRDENHFGLCGVQIHEWTANCRLTADQILYLLSRSRAAVESTRPTGDFACVWYTEGVGYFLAVGSVVFSAKELQEMGRDKLIKTIEEALKEEFE